MKTKHILTALALPAMFAACTADDIVSESNGLQQAERAKLSKDFVLNVNNGIDSRYAVEGTTGLEFIFEASDSIGANLIDEPTFVGTTPVEDPAEWAIVSYIAPAHPFVNVDGEQWMSDGELGVGNYLFTNPYNAADKNRLAAKFQLPVVAQYDSENPNAIIEKYNKAVSFATLYEGDKAANISLKNLYTYPKVRIHFDSSKKVTNVTKVVLSKGDGSENTGFIFKGGLDHKYIANMFDEKTIETWLENAAKTNADVTEADYWNQLSTSHFIIDGKDGVNQTNENDILKYGAPEYTQYLIYEMDENTISNGDTDYVEVRLMLPSENDFTNTGITLYVVTNNGTYSVPFNAGNMSFKSSTLNAQKKIALLRNKSNTLNVDPSALTKSNDLNFGYMVSTAEDWNNLVAKYGDLKKYSAEYKKQQSGVTDTDAADLKVDIISDDFALTADLDMPEVAEFVIKSDLNIEGEVALKNIKVEAGNTLTVKKNAVLTVEQTLNAPSVKVEKGGTLKFAAAYDEDDVLVENAAVTTIANEGKVLVPAGVIAKFDFTNAKDAEIIVGEKAASRAAAEAVAEVIGTNDGIITNYGVINVRDEKKTVTSEDEKGNTKTEEIAKEFINNNPTTAAEYKYDSKTEAWDGVPTVENYGTFNAKGMTNNYGLFKNEGILNSGFSGGAYFYNKTMTGQTTYKGTLEVGETADTYIDSNNGGVIVLAVIKPENFAIHGCKEASEYVDADRGTVKYVLNDKTNNTVTLAGSPVNYLETNVGITLTNTYSYVDDKGKTQVSKLGTLVVNGGVVKIAKYTGKGSETDPYVYAARVATMKVNSGTVAISETVNTVDAVIINADAVLSVPVSATLELSSMSSITSISKADVKGAKSDGYMEVTGLLHLKDAEGDANGIFKGTVPAYVKVPNKGDYITCGNVDTSVSDAEALAAAKTEALKPLIKLCIEKTNVKSENLTWTDFTAAKIATSNWDGVDNTFGVTTVADFVAAWNAIEDQDYKIDTKLALDSQIDNILTVHSDLINKATVGSDDKTTYSGVVFTIKGEVSMATSISKVLNGNAWVGENVFVKSLANQKLSAISYNGVNMYGAFVAAVEDAKADLDNGAWMTLNELEIAKTSEDEDAYPENIYSYLPNYSYVETYETADVYKAVKLWISLSQEYGTTLNSGYEFDTKAVDAADMAKFFNAAYKAGQTDGKLDGDVLYEAAITDITADYIKKVNGWAYNNDQIVAVAKEFATLFSLGTTITPATNK